MRYLLGHRPSFLLGSGLKLPIQGIRQILDIQCGHGSSNIPPLWRHQCPMVNGTLACLGLPLLSRSLSDPAGFSRRRSARCANTCCRGVVENRSPTRAARRQPRFSAKAKIRYLFALFLAARSANSSGIAAQRLRKRKRTGACAKDAEKGRKICGFACGFPASMRWICGGEAAEKKLIACGTKSLKPRIVNLL